MEGQYFCECLKDFTGTYCETKRQFTCNRLCFNGGSCVIGFNNTDMCSCLSDYTGQNCEYFSKSSVLNHNTILISLCLFILLKFI